MTRPLSEAEQQIANFYQSPLGQEIMEVNKEAFLNKHMGELQAKMDAIINGLPLPARLYVKARLWRRAKRR